MSAPEIIIDQDSYPTEDSLNAFEAWWAKAEPHEAALWLVHELAVVAEKIVSCQCRIYGHPEYVRVEFITGGWSGAEDLLGAILSNDLFRAMFYAEWRKGGFHAFEVPWRLLRVEEPAT